MQVAVILILALLPCSFAFGGLISGQGLVNAPECSNPQILQEADRLDSAPGGSKSDLNLQFGWHRFSGGAGTVMPTSCTPTNKCGTQATGWLQGQHPSVSDGVITATVCFHWQSCCDFPVSVRIRNCGAFYVYELMRTPYGLRYCGTKSPAPSVPVNPPGSSSVSNAPGQSPINAPECSNYQILQEADRLDSAPGGSKSDLNLQFGWYRFNGVAGTMMPTSCKQINKCGTQATSWLQGQHPSVSDGVITAKVCFHWKSCCDFPVSVRIRNCGAFYVYELMRTPYGLRYCGTKSSAPMVPVNPPVPVSGPNSVSSAPECLNHQLLEEADRSINAIGGFKDDSRLQFGWYRFSGAAGTMIATEFCTSKNRCGTHATGWLQDRHPTVSEGAVTSKVCFHWTSCCDFPVSIKVRNCGSFYVYQLSGTPGLLRYCARGIGV